ncbi:aldo/keto reductase [Nocardioides sp. C4-1]|uniref:aldo/keto reductase n=1 Tax=Nocardioides sp. C4-1 TaxID=3151851 RepID=UPI0032670941
MPPIPPVGYGVWRVLPESRTASMVEAAVGAGYRLVDTASVYGNEAGVGSALAGVDDVLVTTKVWNDAHGRDRTLRSVDQSARLLRRDVVDVLLLHWPVPARDRYLETWLAMVELLEQGRVRAIGVSNFEPVHLDRLAAGSGVVPILNQVELHPYLQQRRLRAEHDRRGILTQAWSPLGQGTLLADDVLARIAADHDVTPAQVVLDWHRHHGVATVPRTSNPARLAENLGAPGLALTAADHLALDALDRPGDAGRTGPRPDTFVDNDPPTPTLADDPADPARTAHGTTFPQVGAGPSLAGNTRN